MNKKQETYIRRAGAPLPKPEPSLEFDCTFDDIFTSPHPVGPLEVDTSYVHESYGFFARFFGKKDSHNPKKAA